MKRIWIIICMLALLPDRSTACSSIVLKNGEKVFLAKNFDWTSGEGYLLKNLKGVAKRAFYTQAGSPLSWISKYGSVTFNQNGKEMPYGGINEKGLTVEMLWLDNTNYGNPLKHEYLNELEWIQYQLDSYSSVQEVVDNLGKITINPVKGKIHYMIADPAGYSVIVEFLQDTVVFTQKTGTQCQAITNYPARVSQLNYERQTRELRGSNSSHLHRYNVLQRSIDNQAYNKTDLSVNHAFDALDKVTIEKGSFRTFWSIVYDLKQKKVYYKTSQNKQIKELDINQLDFVKELLGIDVNGKFKGNIQSALRQFTPETNTQLIAASFRGLGLGKVNPAELSAHQFQFNSALENSYTQNYAALALTFKASEEKLGYFIFAIMDSEENLKLQKSIESGASSFVVDLKEYTWIYYGLPKGKYAVAVVQDKNNNKQLDFDSQGNPVEKYALSNQANASGGKLPAFSELAVDVSGSFKYLTLELK